MASDFFCSKIKLLLFINNLLLFINNKFIFALLLFEQLNKTMPRNKLKKENDLTI